MASFHNFIHNALVCLCTRTPLAPPVPELPFRCAAGEPGTVDQDAGNLRRRLYPGAPTRWGVEETSRRYDVRSFLDHPGCFPASAKPEPEPEPGPAPQSPIAGAGSQTSSLSRPSRPSLTRAHVLPAAGGLLSCSPDPNGPLSLRRLKLR